MGDLYSYELRIKPLHLQEETVVRKHILAFFVVCSPIFSVFAENVSLVRLNGKTVEKYADTIAQELWRNTWYKRLTVIAGVCAAAYGSYHFFLKKPQIPAAAGVASSIAIAQGQNVLQDAKHKVTNEELEKLILKLGKDLERLEFDHSKVKVVADYLAEQKQINSGMSGTFKTWGKTTLNFVIRESAVAVIFSAVVGAFGKYFRSVDSALDSALYKVFHPGTLQWYIATHTNIYTIFNDLEWHAYCIEHKRLPKKAAAEGMQATAEVMLSEEQVAYHIEAFATTWSLCAREFESILGYMWMKAQQVGAQKAEVAEEQKGDNQESSPLLHAKRFTQITEHVYNVADNFRSEAEKLLQKDVTMRTGLVQSVNRLRLLFMEERSAFSSCEKA